MYLTIKELALSADDVIMVTSSIMKDMQPNLEVIYRPNAIRALCRIIDVRTLFFSAQGLSKDGAPPHLFFRVRWFKASSDFIRPRL